MFEAVSRLLSDAGARAPVLLVLDDLHWADRPTLQLLRHVLRAQDEAPLLIVGTQREGETPAELGELLADLRRDRLLQVVSLTGLDEPAVAALIADAGRARGAGGAGPHGPRGDRRQPLLRRGGRAAPARVGPLDGDPDPGADRRARGRAGRCSLRRLARLSEACRTTLAHAAVLGREFDFTTLRAMADGDEDEVIVALEEALEARLVVEAPGGYAFTHALVRETLYGTLSVAAPPAHARPRGGRDPGRRAAPSPRSRCTTASPGRPAIPPRRSTARCGRATRARELFAWEDAAAHWDGALAVMDRAGADAAVRAQAPGRARGAHGRHRRPRPPDRLPRARAGALRRAARRRARGADPLAARAGALADRLDLRRPPRHPARVPPLRRRAHGARARSGAQGARPPRDRHLDRPDLRPADPARDRGGVARDRDRRAARRRGAVGGRHRGLRLAPDHRRRPARGLRRPGARVRVRRRRPAPVPGLDGVEHPRARWRGRSATPTRASGSSSAR